MAVANSKSQISNLKLADPSARRGMTLIELLVVISIVLFAAAIFVPRLQPLMDHSKVREAARVIQLYLNTARNQAMSSGLSSGVMLEPLAAENGCSMTLTQVETPPLFGGDSANATAMTLAGTANGTSFPIFVGPNGQFAVAPIQFDNWPTVPLYPGDQIQLGYQGFWYIVAPTSSSGIAPGTNTVLNKFNSSSVAQPTTLTAPGNQSVQCLFVYLDVSRGELPAFLTPGVRVPYKIRRWPTKSAAAALQLPATTAIDLTASGNDPIGTSPPAPWTSPPNNPPTIMFAPDGTIDRTYLQQSNGVYQASVPTTPIYLLVGMRKKVNPPNASDANLNDFNSLWVSIDPATGLILIADPGPPLPSSPGAPTPLDFWNSRANARQALANGGGK